MNLPDIQDRISSFSKDKGIDTRVDVRIIDLVSEVGELAKEILKGTNYGDDEFKKTEEWESEIGDVLFSLVCIANKTHTDLEESLNYVLNKYEQRFSNNGDIGSNR